MTIDRKLALEDFCLEGRLTRVVPFSDAHRDSEAYLSWLNDREVVKSLNLPSYLGGVDRATVTQYADQMKASSTSVFLAVHSASNDAFVGTIKAGQISLYSGTADIGIMIGNRDYWGLGLGRDAVSALCAHLFSTARLRKLTAGAMSINPAAMRLFKSLGFQEEAVLRLQDAYEGSYCDHILFGIFADEFTPKHL